MAIALPHRGSRMRLRLVLLLFVCTASMLVAHRIVAFDFFSPRPESIHTTPKKFARAQVQRPLRLPVWPVAAGIMCTVLDLLKLPRLAYAIESKLGGRVAPIQFPPDASPFMLLGVHRHSFFPLDPLRALTQLILPEGFPAHPHSGFDTVTYAYKGGMVHRDSEGMKMSYGDGDVQWMRAGRGIIHEEMWKLEPFRIQQIELFQLWINLPQRKKRSDPEVRVLKNQDIPQVAVSPGCVVRVISGSALGVTCPGSDLGEGVGFFHVFLSPKAEMTTVVPHQSTCVCYVRQGRVAVASASANTAEQLVAYGGDLCVWDTSEHEECTVSCTAMEEGADLILLIGTPLAEPVVSAGPFVASSKADLVMMNNAFASAGPGAFWDHRLNDDEWIRHCRRLNLQQLLSRNLGGISE